MSNEFDEFDDNILIQALEQQESQENLLPPASEEQRAVVEELRGSSLYADRADD